MKKIAKLIEVSFTSRIIIEENATNDTIIRKAKENVRVRLDLEFGDNVTSIEDDDECPFGTFDTDHIS